MIDVLLEQATEQSDDQPETYEFVEAERDGKSIEATWTKRGQYWMLSIPERSMQDDVNDFHKRFGIQYEGKVRALDFEMLQFRLKFMREELSEYERHADAALFELDKLTRAPSLQIGPYEYSEQAMRYHLAGMVDALMDLAYVALGTAHLQGFDTNKAWDKVHRANMSKERGEAEQPSDSYKLKMVKPPGWKAPDHIPEVTDNAHVGQESTP